MPTGDFAAALRMQENETLDLILAVVERYLMLWGRPPTRDELRTAMQQAT